MEKTKIGMDVHKESVYVTAMGEDGTVVEQYEIQNSDEGWAEFKEKCLRSKPDIALEMSTSGKHAARLLRDMGFPIHMAHPASLAPIFKTSSKNDKQDSHLQACKAIKAERIARSASPIEGGRIDEGTGEAQETAWGRYG